MPKWHGQSSNLSSRSFYSTLRYIYTTLIVPHFSTQLAIRQNKRDKKIKQLLDAMRDAYDFGGSTKEIPELALDDRRQEVIKRLFQQAYDCAWFIHEYISPGYGRYLFSMPVERISDLK
jgi:hypothetical protein